MAAQATRGVADRQNSRPAVVRWYLVIVKRIGMFVPRRLEAIRLARA